MDMLRDEIFNLKKNHILDVAGQLFYDRGYALTTLDEIAQGLGVTKPILYQFFPSKIEILSGVCGRTTAFAGGIAQLALDEEGSPTRRLTNMVHLLALEVIKGRIALAVCFREEKHLPPDGLKRLQDDRRKFNRALRLLLEQGQAAGEFTVRDVTVALQAITGLATWIYTWYQPGGKLTPEAIANESVVLVLRLVGAQAGS
jgi:AcrR family transcriptional regulator